MEHRTDDELTREEREALAALRDARPAPDRLEDGVVAALRARGLVRDAPRKRSATWMRSGGRFAALAAGLVAAFALGTLVPRDVEAPPAGTGATTERYLLLLYSPAAEWGGPEDRETVRAYGAWARAEHARGRVEGGEKLDDSGFVLEGTAGAVARAAVPGPGADDVLGGYFILTASDYESAAAVAAGCPHVRDGGKAELRRIEDL